MLRMATRKNIMRRNTLISPLRGEAGVSISIGIAELIRNRADGDLLNFNNRSNERAAMTWMQK